MLASTATAAQPGDARCVLTFRSAAAGSLRLQLQFTLGMTWTHHPAESACMLCSARVAGCHDARHIARVAARIQLEDPDLMAALRSGECRTP